MDTRKNKQKNDRPDDLSSKGAGRQGVDKAPGEDKPRGNEDKMRNAQKAKKVDADPEEEKRP